MRLIALLLAITVPITLTATPVIAAPRAPEDTKTACTDGVDNDHDGHVDCADQDCQDFVFCRPERSAAPPPPVYPIAPPPPVYPSAPPPIYLPTPTRETRSVRDVRTGKILLGVGVPVWAIGLGLLFGSMDDDLWKPGKVEVEIDRPAMFVPGLLFAVAGTAMTIAGIVLWVRGAQPRTTTTTTTTHWDYRSNALRF